MMHIRGIVARKKEDIFIFFMGAAGWPVLMCLMGLMHRMENM